MAQKHYHTASPEADQEENRSYFNWTSTVFHSEYPGQPYPIGYAACHLQLLMTAMHVFHSTIVYIVYTSNELWSHGAGLGLQLRIELGVQKYNCPTKKKNAA